MPIASALGCKTDAAIQDSPAWIVFKFQSFV
jgi:hypothetical protein